MTCDRTRELLMELEVAAFDDVAHLRTCPDCRAFADQLRAADRAMADHVEAFTRQGDFRAEWDRAKITARRPSRVLPALGVALLALAAVALLMVRPPPPITEPPSPVTAPAVAEPPPVAAPAPAPRPAPAPAPSPRPPRAVAPRPVSRPVVRAPPAVSEPVAEPVAAAPPVASRPEPPRGASVVVHVDPALSGIRGADLTCGGTRLQASRAGDVLRFDGVPAGSCEVVFRGPDGIRATVTGGTWRLVRADGRTTLIRQ